MASSSILTSSTAVLIPWRGRDGLRLVDFLVSDAEGKQLALVEAPDLLGALTAFGSSTRWIAFNPVQRDGQLVARGQPWNEWMDRRQVLTEVTIRPL